MKSYFLAKTEPEVYSIDNLEKDGETVWDGVHNYAALAAIKSWKIGDRVFAYHSGKEKAIVGEMEVVCEPYENPMDKGSWVAKVKFVKKYSKPVTLQSIKASQLFNNFSLVRQGRLSTMKCDNDFVDWVFKQI